MPTNERYSRQILFSDIGAEGQAKLLASRVLIVGCGALGAAQTEMLARAGVGKIRVVDRDFVEFSNLQRQTLYKEEDARLRLPKAIACKNRIVEINSEIELEAFVEDVNRTNVERLIEDCDLVLDGTDNFLVRYLVNEACVKNSVKWIYGAAVSSYGVTMTIIPRETPCLKCIFEEMPDAGSSQTCDTAGVIMPIISFIAATQVSEALKILTGNFAKLHRGLLQFDVWQNDWRKIKLAAPRADCSVCALREFALLESSEADFVSTLCGRDAVQILPPKPTQIDLPQLAKRLAKLGDIKENEYLLRFQVDGNELTIFRDARAIIRGTDDVTVARSLYAKYVGL